MPDAARFRFGGSTAQTCEPTQVSSTLRAPSPGRVAKNTARAAAAGESS
jgi:hypothetical protein